MDLATQLAQQLTNTLKENVQLRNKISRLEKADEDQAATATQDKTRVANLEQRLGEAKKLLDSRSQLATDRLTTIDTLASENQRAEGQVTMLRSRVQDLEVDVGIEENKLEGHHEELHQSRVERHSVEQKLQNELEMEKEQRDKLREELKTARKHSDDRMRDLNREVEQMQARVAALEVVESDLIESKTARETELLAYLEAKETEADTLRAQVTDVQNLRGQEQGKHEDWSRQIEELQDALRDRDAGLEDAARQVEHMERRFNEVRAELDDAPTRIGSSEGDLSIVEAERDAVRIEFESLQAQNKTLVETIRGLEAEFHILTTQARTTIDAGRQTQQMDVASSERRIRDLEELCSSWNTQYKADRCKITKLEYANGKLHRENTGLKLQLKNVDGEVKQKRSTIGDQATQLTGLRTQLAKANLKAEQCLQDRRKCEADLKH